MKLFNPLRKKERNSPVIMPTIYEDLRASGKALRPKGLKILSVSDDNIQISIRSQIALIEHVITCLQNCIDQFCRLHQLNIVNISLCLREALANAIIHGNLEIPSTLKEDSWRQFESLVREREILPEFADRQVMIRCRLTTEHITLEVEDQGRGFDPCELRALDLASPSALKDPDLINRLSRGGRGLLFIKAFTDQVFWNSAGNCITMIKNFPTL
jgi:anti-sigma regulatory factor (Ser/Thr protein kinase)